MSLRVPIALALAAVAGTAQANRPVDTLELDRYVGTWHEIAHLPMFFQRKCVDEITATYTPRDDGRIEVRNACRTQDGSRNESTGVAKTVDGAPGQLKVRFAPAWLSWIPGVWADYWVIDLDPDYQWAVVGGPSRKYLWILSRTPTMERALYERLVGDAAGRGYPVSRLVQAAPIE
nr:MULTISPECIES: lipocalin family protein [Luteimonas]